MREPRRNRGIASASVRHALGRQHRRFRIRLRDARSRHKIFARARSAFRGRIIFAGIRRAHRSARRRRHPWRSGHARRRPLRGARDVACWRESFRRQSGRARTATPPPSTATSAAPALLPGFNCIRGSSRRRGRRVSRACTRFVRFSGVRVVIARIFVARFQNLTGHRNLRLALVGAFGRATARVHFVLAGIRLGQWSAQSRQCFFHSLFPILPAESLMRSCVPANRFVVVRSALFHGRQFERDHGIARLGIKFAKFRRSLRSVLDLADAGLNLPPVSHVARLYQPSQPICQQTR